MCRCSHVRMPPCADVQAPRRPEFDGPSGTSRVRGRSDSRPPWGDRTPTSPCPAVPCRAMRRFMIDFPLNLAGKASCEIRQSCSSSEFNYPLPLDQPSISSFWPVPGMPPSPPSLLPRTPLPQNSDFANHPRMPRMLRSCPHLLSREILGTPSALPQIGQGLPSKRHYPEAFG
jgi:hypothetical protein